MWNHWKRSLMLILTSISGKDRPTLLHVTDLNIVSCLGTKLTRGDCFLPGSNPVTVNLHHCWPTNGVRESTISRMSGRLETENVTS